jgi:hypothetical protein
MSQVQQKIKFLKQKESELAGELKAVCDFKTTSAEGYTYTVSQRKGSVKYADIPELLDVNLEPYRGDPVTMWRLNFTKQFEI